MFTGHCLVGWYLLVLCYCSEPSGSCEVSKIFMEWMHAPSHKLKILLYAVFAVFGKF